MVKASTARRELIMKTDNRETIHAANIATHSFEAPIYELLHPEVYGREEQKRIASTLESVDRFVTENMHRAMDFGAGTGNLTGKLLQMGYVVTAVDISAEMCALLKRKYRAYVGKKKLRVVYSPVEDLQFDEEFDVVACYSVLHHLPDYRVALRRLSFFLKKGGVMYIDHEASPHYWSRELHRTADGVKSLYFHSNPILNALYFAMRGIEIPSLDYTLSDYWHKKEHHIDHKAIERVFREAHFEFFKRSDYHLKGTWIPNPLFHPYRYFCKPEMSYWIAKK